MRQTHNLINNLEDFIEQLKASNADHFPELIKALDTKNIDFSRYENWDEATYTRNCIARTPNFELIFICWKPNHFTPIHSHDGQKCWVYQVSGEMIEKRFDITANGTLKETKKLTLLPGKITYMEDRMGYHVLENKSKNKATTLHLYLAPIDTCEYFCEEEKVFKIKKLRYD